MQEVLPEGGLVRKLWIGESAKYREHLLRLDPQSRRNRFSGGVSDYFISKYIDTLSEEHNKFYYQFHCVMYIPQNASFSQCGSHNFRHVGY